MDSVGSYLQYERVSRGVHLDEIASHTRISSEMLDALEQDRFDLLPGGVFTISFVRQYCAFIGVEADYPVKLLKQAQQPPVEAAELAPEAQDQYLGRGPWDRIKEEWRYLTSRYGSASMNVAFGLALVLGGLFSYQAWDERSQRIAAERVAAEAEAERLASQRIESFTATARPRMPIELELEVVDTVWVRALADGERVLEAILRPGDRRPIFAEEQVALRVGNAGGVLLALNGEPLPPIGPRGQVRRVTVTPEGMEVLNSTPPRPRQPAVRESVRVPVTTASLRWAELAWSGRIE